MQYIVLKSGLEIFDVARAYGLAACLYYGAGFRAPVIIDAGTVYLLEHDAEMPKHIPEECQAGWAACFDHKHWRDVLRTYKQAQFEAKVKKARNLLSERFGTVIEQFLLDRVIANEPSKDLENNLETLSGALEPTAFKGLRAPTRGTYSENQVKVGSVDWALACLGGSLVGKYISQRTAGNKWEYYVNYWLPERVTFDGVLDLREKLRSARLSYLGAENAAAHQAVLLAKAIRRRALTELKCTDRFSEVVFFTLFQSSQQIKPSSAGHASLSHLLKLALDPKPEAENVLNIWDYLFRRGSTKGAEGLAIVVTEFVIRPNLDSYERCLKELIRYLRKGVKGEFQYDEKTLKEVMAYV